jgi:Ni/Fe-hydrogenase subunit HybB-like protein
MRELAQVVNLPGGYVNPTGTWVPGTSTITGPATSFTNIASLISRLIPYFILFAGIGTLFMIIFAGYELLTGANDPKKMEQGKQRLTYGIVGFFIVFLAFWVVQIAGVIFGISEFACVFGSFGGLTCGS